MAQYHLVRAENIGFNTTVTIKKEPGAIARFFGVETHTLEFYSSDGRSWYRNSDSLSAGILLESRITHLIAKQHTRVLFQPPA